MTTPTDSGGEEYVAIVDQNEVTDEVRNIAVNYDPLNRSGHEGFHVTDDGERHIDDANVMREHKLIEKKVPNRFGRVRRFTSSSHGTAASRSRSKIRSRD